MTNFSLNKEQKKAVFQLKGRLLILAGAGSGKTSVITHRIAHLVEKGISPQNILGLTFTNKAALEMRGRVFSMIGAKARSIHLSTFHSFCMKVLRLEIEKLGYTKNFSLYDEKDMRRLFQQVLKELHLEDISFTTFLDPGKEENPQIIHKMSSLMKAHNALDFTRLITLTVELFEKFPSILEKYQDQFHYIMIDEYQDTNHIQSTLTELLAQKHQNLCVVGDDDQSIYSWRGANVDNILHFKSDTKVKLEQNYRSIPSILNAANSLIQNNKNRHCKMLKPTVSSKDPIHIFHAPTDLEEAQSVVDRILSFKKKGFAFSDMAILYRSNILSKPFELLLLQASWKEKDKWVRGIPYQIFGGLELSERTEIKDLFSYLRFISNTRDETSMLRIINVPRRGISEKTLTTLLEYCRKHKKTPWTVLKNIEQEKKFFSRSISTKAVAGIKSFTHLIQSAQNKFFSNQLLNKTLQWFIQEVDFKQSIKEDTKSEKAQKLKMENILECVRYLEMYETEAQGEKSLQDFISSTLLANQPSYKKNQRSDGVNLITFHSAKGLEFPICFIVALEDHIVPHEKSVKQTSLEEERRLFYVALTRCKKHLFLSMARKRQKMGKSIVTNPSQFLFEIPKPLFKNVSYKFFE